MNLATVTRAAVVLALSGLFVADARAADAASLIDAARAGDTDRVAGLLVEGADVDARAPDGTTALLWAVYREDVGMVRELLDAGADPNAVNDYGARPLSEAAVTGNPELVGLLLDAGADPDAANAYGQTPLMTVARTDNLDAARRLLDAGADINATETWQQQTALMWATAQRRPTMVRLLLEHGADPDARSRINDWSRQVSGEPRAAHRYRGGMTALLYAGREGCVECARALVEHGADIDLAEPDGVTPLQMAINNLHFDLAKVLIEAGAHPDLWDWWGRSPLYAAVDVNTLPRGGRADRPTLDQTTSAEVIRLLLEAGANPNLQLKRRPPFRAVGADRGCDNMLVAGTTPLLRAAKAFDAEAIELLLAHGADVNLPQVIGITPVMAAAGLGSWDCDTRGHFTTGDVQRRSIRALELLLDAGGELEARVTGTRGRFPEQRAAMVERVGQTALHGAAFWGWNDVVAFLVERGASLEVEDARGMTPYDAALGRAGGNGFGGNRTDVHEGTAEFIEQLMAGPVAERN